jgi:hypothetical protein
MSGRSSLAITDPLREQQAGWDSVPAGLRCAAFCWYRSIGRCRHDVSIDCEGHVRTNLLVRAVLTAAVAGGLIAPLPIGAAAAAASAVAATEMQRDRVHWRAVSDPRWEVRTAAGAAAAAAANDPQGVAIVDFLTIGLAKAELRAASFERNNVSVIKYAVRNSATGSAVRRAGTRALTATHDEKDEFVRRGLDEAKRQDLADQDQHAGEVAAQAQEDRDYIAELARTDPGAQVRSAASFAANSGRDEDVAEFFAYYWAAGARLDDEAYRLRLADLDATGAASLERLRGAALTAQAAELAESGAAAEKLHVETVAAWAALAASAEGTSVDWAAERDRAAAQADAWGAVAAFAVGATTVQDWAGVIARAGNSRQAWTVAAEQAARQTAVWLAIARDARDNAAGTPVLETGSSL